jgi:RNA polymerase sigma-70 factor (ECF subfamily)
MDESTRPFGLPERTPLSLLERLRNNDAAAWQQLMVLYTPLVRLWCRRAGLGEEDAQDVIQEVFASAATGFGDFHRDRPGDTFRGWLRTIARNAILMYGRRNRGRPRAEGGSSAWQFLQDLPDPLPPPDEDEQNAVLGTYLAALEQIRDHFEPQTWQAFWRTAVEGVAPLDLATEIGMTPAAIRQAKFRVLRRLKQEMGELLG